AGAKTRGVRHGGEGDPAARDADRRRRRRDLGDAVSVPRRRHRHRRRPRAARSSRHRARDRRARQAAARPCGQETDLPEGELVATESYPDDLRYHPEHDWARIDGDQAVLGITWYAQDSLGELVLFDAPEVGATIAKDASYAEVESVKAVSDVVAPLS